MGPIAVVMRSIGIRKNRFIFCPKNMILTAARFGYFRFLKVISLLFMQKKWLRLFPLLKRTERHAAQAPALRERQQQIFNFQYSIPACPG
jgi:hypothetical protein